MNNNGHLSAGQPFRDFTPQQLPLDAEIPLIAVFWADVDTRTGGSIWYRNTTSPALLQRAKNNIRRAYPSVSDIDYLFIATWYSVGYYNQHTDKVLSNYDIIFYSDLVIGTGCHGQTMGHCTVMHSIALHNYKKWMPRWYGI